MPCDKCCKTTEKLNDNKQKHVLFTFIHHNIKSRKLSFNMEHVLFTFIYHNHMHVYQVQKTVI